MHRIDTLTIMKETFYVTKVVIQLPFLFPLSLSLLRFLRRVLLGRRRDADLSDVCQISFK